MTKQDFTQQILPFKNKLFRFALQIVGNVAEAEDVVQEVFIKLWKSREKLQEYNNLEAWCMRLTKNQAIDKIRSKHRRVTDLDGVEITETDATPHRIAEVNDLMNLVYQSLAKLPEKQRQIMHLRDIEGFTYQEISDTLEIPLNQVKVSLYRARQFVKLEVINQQSYGI